MREDVSERIETDFVLGSLSIALAKLFEYAAVTGFLIFFSSSLQLIASERVNVFRDQIWRDRHSPVTTLFGRFPRFFFEDRRQTETYALAPVGFEIPLRSGQIVADQTFGGARVVGVPFVA